MDTDLTAVSLSPSVTPAQLAARLGRAGAPLIIDVRKASAIAAAAHAAGSDASLFRSLSILRTGGPKVDLPYRCEPKLLRRDLIHRQYPPA